MQQQCTMLLLGTTDQSSPLQQLRGQGDLLERIWNSVLSMRVRYKLEGHSDAVCSMAQLLDGRLVTGSWDNTIKVWRPPESSPKPKTRGKKKHRSKDACQLTLEGHTNHVTCIAPLANGGLVSGSWDRSLRVWNAAGECEAILEGHCNYVNCVISMVDGHIISGSQDQDLRVWERTAGGGGGNRGGTTEEGLAEGWESYSVLVLSGHRNDITCVVSVNFKSRLFTCN